MFEKEGVIKSFHSDPITLIGFYFAAAVLAALGVWFYKILILVGILVLLLGEVSRRAETFLILETGVERKYDLFASSVKFIEFEKIQEIDVEQSFIHRLFGIGTLKFDTSGTNTIELYFYGVKDPYGLEKIIRDKMTAR